MTSVEETEAPLRDLIRERIDERYGSVRGYARKRANNDIGLIERERRLINKWLDGTIPTKPEHVASLERDLGIPAIEFAKARANPAFDVTRLGQLVAALERNPDLVRDPQTRQVFQAIAESLDGVAEALRRVLSRAA